MLHFWVAALLLIGVFALTPLLNYLINFGLIVHLTTRGHDVDAIGDGGTRLRTAIESLPYMSVAYGVAFAAIVTELPRGTPPAPGLVIATEGGVVPPPPGTPLIVKVPLAEPW